MVGTFLVYAGFYDIAHGNLVNYTVTQSGLKCRKRKKLVQFGPKNRYKMKYHGGSAVIKPTQAKQSNCIFLLFVTGNTQLKS